MNRKIVPLALLIAGVAAQAVSRQNSISLGNQRLWDTFEITKGPCKLPSCSNSS